MVPSYRVCSVALTLRVGWLREEYAGIKSRGRADSPAQKPGAPPTIGRKHRAVRLCASYVRSAKNAETLPTKSLADVQQVHHENQGLTGLNDRTSAAVTVRHVGGNLQATTAADLHAEQTLIPATDNLANAHLER